MPTRSTVVIINGRSFVEDRDADTNDLIQRFPLPFSQSPLKEKLEAELRAQAQDLIVFNHFIEQAIARGESAPAITELRGLETQLYNRAKATYLEWRVL